MHDQVKAWQEYNEEDSTMATRKKIVALAKKIASSKKEFTEQDPEYYALE